MTNQEYRALEDAFLARHDALCEDKSPLECDCPACPCKGSQGVGAGDKTGGKHGNHKTAACGYCDVCRQRKKA